MTTHPTTAKISRGLRVLPPKKAQSVNEEHANLQRDTASIEQWWTDSRWNHTKREYSGTCHAVMLFCILIKSSIKMNDSIVDR